MSSRVASFQTDDGLEIRLPLGRLGERGVALAIDGLLVALASGLLAIAHALVDHLVPVALAAFIVRHAYFAGWGTAGHGATPGKRAMGLRVVALGGGPLTLRRLLVRSIARDFELGLPILAVSGIWVEAGDFTLLAGMAWLLAFAAFPLLHPRRRRLADVLAGTAVVRCSRPAVAPLPVVDPRAVVAPADRAVVSVLGVEHMHSLARLLRDVEPTTDAGQEVRRAVARRLATKLGRCPDQAAEAPDAFLRRLYAELAAYHARERRAGRATAVASAPSG